MEFLYSGKKRMLLDQMGLGKTLQVLLACRAAQARIVLVACPRIVMKVWKDEAAKWWPEAICLEVHGTAKEFTKAVADWKALQAATPDKSFIILTTYARVKDLPLRAWSAVCFDEPHRNGLANRKSKIFVEAKRLTCHAMFFVTGTPLKRGIDQLWSYLHLIDRKAYPSYWRWVEQTLATMKGDHGEIEFFGPKDPVAFRKLISQYGIRRMKKQVLKDLPEKQRQRILFKVDPALMKIYNTLDEDLMWEGEEGTPQEGGFIHAANRGGLNTRLLQLIACPRSLGVDMVSPFWEPVSEICAGAKDENEKVAHFTPYIDSVEHNSQLLNDKGHLCFKIHSKMKKEQQDWNLEQFKKAKGHANLFYSYGMGIGWDIAQQCSIGVGWGFPYAPDDCYQAEDRMHRFHTKSTVNIYYPVPEGTVYENVVDVLDGKASWQTLLLNR